MRNDWVIGSVAVFIGLLLLGLFGYGYWYLNKNNKKVLSAQTTQPDTSATTDNNQLTIQTQPSATLGSNNVGLQDNTSQQPSSSSTPQTKQAPEPATFSQYDQYKDNTQSLFGDITVGTGLEATIGKKLIVKYKGWLTDGRLFDQTTDKALAFTIGNHEVISGWEEGLLGMKAGGTRRVIVPPSVGYGAQGKSPIPPNAVMVFDIQLISVE